MQVKDISVIVRDKTLARKGVITPEFLDIKINLVFNGTSTWTLKLPKTHPMVPYLATAGSGIIVALHGTEYLSGPTLKPEEVTNSANPDGTYTFTGVDDTALLAYALAFPEPSNSDPATQTQANDVRTDNAETLMREYVGENIAGLASAPVGRVAGFRQYLRLETVNKNLGPTIRKAPRFQNLGALLGEIALLADLGFRVVQRDDELVFEVYQLNDVSDLVRFDIESGTLTSTSLQRSAPSITRAIVAGQGEGTDRQIVSRTTADSVSAEAEWGLVIEQFIDQRNTDVTSELEQAGDERLIKDGFTAVAVKAIPSDDQTMLFIKDWNLGDTVGLVTYGQPTTSRITGAVIIANSQRVAIGAAIGNLDGFDAKSALQSRVDDTERRVSKIERTVELGTSVAWGSITGKPTTFPPVIGSGAGDAIAGNDVRLNTATTSQEGISELATNAETIAGIDGGRVVTPAGLASLTATTSRRGLAEFATDAEAIAKSSGSHAVTPSGLGAALALPVQGAIPSSVVVGSGSASVAADGTVTFSGCSSVSLNDVFPIAEAGALYEIVVAAIVGTSGAQLYFRNRVSGADVSTASSYGSLRYMWYNDSEFGSGVSAASGNTINNAMEFGWGGLGANYPTLTTMLIENINSAARTRFKWHGSGDGTRIELINGMGAQSTASAHTGLTIFPSTGTITGQIKVRRVT